jgi:O-antigen/teichoic acid export membrane protein
MNYFKSAIYLPVVQLLNRGPARSIIAKKNILANIFIKGTSILTSLILVPLTIGYIDTVKYGIWLTISSVIAWFSFFDIGLTQGLRNKFAEALARNEHDVAQGYVSTAYTLLSLIFLAVWLIFMIVNQFLDWSVISNTPQSMAADVSTLAVIVFTYFCIQFVLRIITTILIASQQPAKSALIDLFSQVFSLCIVLVLVRFSEGSLILLGLALCISPVTILFIAHVFLFKGKFKRYRPSWKKVNFSYTKDLFNLGIIFFVIQLAAIIQFQTANFIIAQNFSPGEVTPYNIVYKYFSVLSMLFAIFLTPFWSASTEAFLKKDFQWIKNAIRNYNILGGIIIVCGVFMLFFSQKIYTLWLGEGTVHISNTLSIAGLIYFSISIFADKYVAFLNGISALRLQFITSLISPFIYIIVAMIMIKVFKMGAYSLFIAGTIAGFNGYLLAPFQYFQIIHRSKRGIWIK